MEYTIKDLEYGGKFHNAFWNIDFNKNANITNGLANCTTAVIGFCIAEGNPLPVSHIVSASNWDNYLINGWTDIPYDETKIKVGDILQWKTNCHVAKVAKIVDGIIYMNASFYTGEHGVSIWNGGYDTRDSFSSLQQLSDFMSKNYPDRFYHCWNLDKECQAVGGLPDKILIMPNELMPVERNENVDQIQTTDNTLRIRTEPNLSGAIVGHVGLGYYNVLNKKDATKEDMAAREGLKEWYEIAPNRWCGNVTTIYLPSDEEEDIVKLIKEYAEKMQKCIKVLEDQNKDYKERLVKIHDLSEV